MLKNTFNGLQRLSLNDNDNEVYFTLATSNSRIDKYRTVVEKHIKTTKYNAKKCHPIKSKMSSH